MRKKIMLAVAGSLVLGAVLTNGCAPSQARIQSDLAPTSAGLIGCPQGEIKISDYKFDRLTFLAPPPPTWVATCKGKTFYCTGGRKSSCKEGIQPCFLGAEECGEDG